MKQIVAVIMMILFAGCSAVVDTQVIPMGEQKQVQPEVQLETEEIVQPSSTSFFSSGRFKVAFLMPHRSIGKYAITTINSAMGYLVAKDADFEVNVYKLRSAGSADIEEKLAKIASENYDLVIAPVTGDIAVSLCDAYQSIDIFIPTVHKNMTVCQNGSVYFGGIDYFRQIETLLNQARSPKLVVLSDTSPLTAVLNSYVEQLSAANFLTIQNKNNIKPILKSNASLISGATLLLNTPLSQSALILSQLSYYDIAPQMILSTQINYDPYLFRLTQLKDRENFFIANSLSNRINRYNDAVSVISSELRYDRVNYATVSGLDYFYADREGGTRAFREEMYDNQLTYDIQTVQALQGMFK